MPKKKIVDKIADKVVEISTTVAKVAMESGGTMLAGGCCEDHKAKVQPEWTDKHDAIVKKYEEEKPKEVVIIPKDEDLFPATKKMPKKPIPSEGDAKWCKTCNANTFYSDHCLVCTPFTEEQMLTYAGNLNYIKNKYPHHVNVK